MHKKYAATHHSTSRTRVRVAAALFIFLTACSGGGGTTIVPEPVPPGPTAPPTVNGPAWFGFGRDAQHSSVGAIATQSLDRLLWQTPVDLAPQLSGNFLLIHYGSPVITSRNTVIVGVKTTATGGFRIEARNGSNGSLLWSVPTDYLLPAALGWLPSYNITLSSGNRLYAPAAGGKLLVRSDPDNASGTLETFVFYGVDTYNANRDNLDATVHINTPLTADAAGNVYFGFTAQSSNRAGLVSGIARVGTDGRGTWVSAAAAARDSAVAKMATNSAPALSPDGRTLYVAVTNAPIPGFVVTGKLLALDAATLATKTVAALIDPAAQTSAWVHDNGTSSPTVGPDGDVYFGVLEANAPAHHFTGWLLHFNADLTQTKTPGAFGWDNTPSIVPASMVPSYTGASPYLLLTKYNNYGGAGGDGGNRIAILDPNQTQNDKIAGNPVMKEVLTKLGPTPDPSFPGGVKEWCINAAAVDPATKSALVNSEDGFLYRWDLTTNTLSQKLRLNGGVGQAYTPTAIGPDGVVYSINNSVLFAAGRS